MNNSTWKLVALSGIVGLGLLVVFQAQKGLDLNTLGKAFGIKPSDADVTQTDGTPQPEADGVGDQFEPAIEAQAVSGLVATDADLEQAFATPNTRRAVPQMEGLEDSASNTSDPFATDNNEVLVQTTSSAVASRRRAASGGVDFRRIEEDNLQLDETPTSEVSARRAAPRLTAGESDSLSPDATEPQLAAPRLQNTESSENDMPAPKARRAIGSKVAGLFDDDPEPARSGPEIGTATAPRNLEDEAPASNSIAGWTAPSVAPTQPSRTLAAPATLLDTDETLAPAQPSSSKIRLAQSDEPSPELAPADQRPAKRQPAPIVNPAESDDDATFFNSGRPSVAREPSQPVGPLTPNSSSPVGRGEKGAPAFPRVEEDNPAITATPRGQQRPTLSIDKVAPQAAVLGQPMVYTIRVRNVGTIPAHQVVVEDRVPRGVELDGTNPRAEMSEKTKTLIWKLGTLESGQERTISVRVVPTNEGPIGSVATVNFSTEVSSHTVVSAATLRFELLAAERATLGQPVAFTFRVTNTGRSDATGVVIRNVLPAALRHSDGDDLEYAVGTLPAGKTKEVTLSVTAAQAGKIVNQAVVTADGGISVQAEASVLVQGVSIDVVRNGPKRLFPKKNGRFTNIITNPTAQPMLNVSVVETIPPGVEYVASSPEGEHNPARRSVTWNLSRLDARQSRQFEITLASNEVGSKVSVVRAYDSTGASGEKVTTTTVTGAPSLAVEVLDGTSPLEVGEQVTYRIRITNRGTDAATNVHVATVLPTSLQMLQVGGQLRFRQTGNRIEFEPIPRLNANESVISTITLRAAKAGDARLVTQVSSDQAPQPLSHEEAAIVYSP